MSDPQPSAPWLESDEEFEGVGAHRLNSRYDPVDEDDAELVAAAPVRVRRTVGHTEVRRLVAATLPAHYVRRFDWHDGSHWQPDAGPMDLAALRAVSPGDAIAWKATQSTRYVDPTFRFVRSEMVRLRFLLRLYYHWLSSTTDPEQQAAHFLATIGGWVAGDLAMLDAEEAGITVEWCLGWLEYVERTTKRASPVYTGLYVAGGTIWKDDRIREGRYGPRPMHLAAYVSLASLLSHLTRTGNLDRLIHAWQFTSDGDFAGRTATTPGITGRADWNTFFDRRIYERAAQVSPPVVTPPVTVPPVVVQPPTPTPVPVPAPEGDDDMRILTNAEDIDDHKAGTLRWKTMLDESGDYPVYRAAWCNGLEAELFGPPVPMTTAQLEELGEWKPKPAGPPSATIRQRYRATIDAHTVDLIPVAD